MTKRGSLQKLWSPTQKELNMHIALWSIKDGLPNNTVVTEAIHNFVQLLRAIEGRVRSRFPFLSVLHDPCTTGSGKKGVVGTSVCFITWNWYFCRLALLVTVHNGSHELCKVKTLITSRIEKFYGIAIEDVAQFTMSDTTPSARKVSKLFEDFTPTDCACLFYMGMRENTEAVYVMDPETNLQK
ncbi:hypothetical protein PI124_g5340 [Phytophthora idaei]|nr:hypothetical protein PI125_g5528 [Phytophthora idaei]KAG3153583.1 hypothetical protein PI126_g10009 [Phytophthora idaei]KAG3250005.1 hypothetical protein PI124_g5340 [Phytophthora idaei]